MSSFLNSTTGFVSSGLKQGSQGVMNVATSTTATLNSKYKDNSTSSPHAPAKTLNSNLTSPMPPVSQETQPCESHSGSSSTGNILSSSASFVINPSVNAGKAGASALQDIASSSASIGQKVGKSGLDFTQGVTLGTVDLAGTAVGGIVNLAAETSGKVFQPVASGLKAIEGLEGLGEGLEKINGLPVAAVKQVGDLTLKAMNMSGMTPTFFNPDGDGVVKMDDTIRGLLVLGLPDQYAKYAAYALHTIFSYATSDNWIPSMDTQLPIHINKMNNTRWGRNWGSFERMDWCDDVDVETFFQTTEEASGLEKWKATFKKGRQYFGVLLLIFEWGTTWPFYMPPAPIADIPFKDDIGKVVRTVLLPSIFANFQRAREADPENNLKQEPPSEEAPADSKAA